ncbi:MAG: RHS repeat-associated core domain-containing protein, partial [Marinicellaceae bacterium]
QYDYSGQRINHQSNGQEKHFLYDGLTLIAETNTIGNTLARYHYGDRYQLAETRITTNSYFHVDSLGSNVAVTNQDGSIQARYEYDAYGNLLTQAGSSEQPFGFTGHQFDQDTSLYYANARYYDATTARFNREDPLAGNQQTPPSLHRYLYANANPTVFIDPDGKQAIALDAHTRIRTEEDVARVVAESEERIANRKAIRERKAYIKTEENENLMYVSESKNNKVLLKNNVSRLETVKKAHIAACVYNPKCNAISTDIGDITRVSNEELLDLFDIKKGELLDVNTGFKSGLFRDNDTNELIFATAGTDGFFNPDMIANLLQGAGALESQYVKVAELALRIRKVASNINQPLSFTGHSLGGGLASLAALVTNNQATTFNAAGLHRNHKYLYSKLVQYDEPANSFEYNNPNIIKPKTRNQKQLINAIYVQGEVLSAIQDYSPLSSATGNRIELQRGSTDGFLKQHGSNNVCMALGSYCDYSKGGKRGYESALYYKYAE